MLFRSEIASLCNWWKSTLEDHCAKVHHSAHPPFMLCVGRARRVLLVFLFSWADVVPLSSISEVSDARVRSARLFFLVLHKKCNFTLSLCNGTLCFSRHLVFVCVCVFFFGSSGVILSFFVSLFFFFSSFAFSVAFLDGFGWAERALRFILLLKKSRLHVQLRFRWQWR